MYGIYRHKFGEYEHTPYDKLESVIDGIKDAHCELRNFRLNADMQNNCISYDSVPKGSQAFGTES